MNYDARSAECLVFPFKDGIFSAVGHDLKIRVDRFAIEVERADPLAAESKAGPSIKAKFDARSLRVVAAMREGREEPNALAESDKRKIQQSIAEEVLEAAQHPELVFSSTRVEAVPKGFHIQGKLTLHGVTCPVDFLAARTEQGMVAEVLIHQPDFGVKPYTAMLGTLKIKPGLRVQLILPGDVAAMAKA